MTMVAVLSRVSDIRAEVASLVQARPGDPIVTAAFVSLFKGGSR
jgi:hypothetical protein